MHPLFLAPCAGPAALWVKNGNPQLFWASVSLFVLKKKWEIFSSIHMITLQNISLKFCQKTDVVISAVTIVCDSQGSTQHQQKVSICDRKQRKASLNPIPRASHRCEADLKRGLGSPPSDLSLAPQPRPSAPWSLLYSVEQISSQADSWVACEGCSLEKLIILIV